MQSLFAEMIVGPLNILWTKLHILNDIINEGYKEISKLKVDQKIKHDKKFGIV